MAAEDEDEDEDEDGGNLRGSMKSFIITGKSLLHFLNNQLIPPLPHEIITNILKMPFKPLSPSSGTHMPSLPPEIIVNIFKRLPFQSLLRFQHACKEWSDLFESPLFIQAQATHNTPIQIYFTYYRRLALVRYDHNNPVTVEEVPIPKTEKRLSKILNPYEYRVIIGSCNGLLCIKFPNPFSLLLLNPATMEWRQVPISAKGNLEHDKCFWGFGHTSMALDNKIVCICPDGVSNEGNFYFVKLVKVFSLRKWSWGKVELGALKSIAIDGSCVAVDGAMFWLGLSHEFGGGIVVSFDLAVEVFTLIPMPSSNINVRSSKLDVYKNNVSMIQAYDSRFDLWVLEVPSGPFGKRCWSKKYSITTPWHLRSPKCSWRDEIVFKKNFDTAFFFSFTDHNKWKKIHCSSSAFSFEVSTSFSYVESTASICPTTPLLNNIKLKLPLSHCFS